MDSRGDVFTGGCIVDEVEALRISGPYLILPILTALTHLRSTFESHAWHTNLDAKLAPGSKRISGINSRLPPSEFPFFLLHLSAWVLRLPVRRNPRVSIPPDSIDILLTKFLALFLLVENYHVTAPI